MKKRTAPYPCVKCGEIKQPGIRCKACVNAGDRERYNRDIELSRKRHREKPSQHDRRAKSRREYEANKAKIIARTSKRNREQPEKANQYRKTWRERSPEKVAAQLHRRRARLLKCEGSFTADEWAAVKDRQGGKCFDCGVETKLTVGHLVPLCLGGANAIDNIVGQCKSCNSKQGAKLHHSVKPLVASF